MRLGRFASISSTWLVSLALMQQYRYSLYVYMLAIVLAAPMSVVCYLKYMLIMYIHQLIYQTTPKSIPKLLCIIQYISNLSILSLPMIQQDQHIIYVSQAKCVVTLKQTETMKTGMLEKKIVITTRRCLFFQSLSNQVLELEFEVLTKKKKADDDKNNQKQRPKRLSINQFPEHSFPINDRECKIMIDEEPSCHKYLVKIGLRNFLKSITGIVLLKNLSKMRFELLAFPTLKDGFRFCKAVVCSKAWFAYQKHCESKNLKPNKMWARLLCEIANNQKAATLIDPDLFEIGSRQQISAFKFLINQIPFAHSFQHRYSITSPEICQYSQEFIQDFEQKTHSLIFQRNNLTMQYFNSIFSSRIKLEHLMHLDLSHNKLGDQVFASLQKFTRQCKKLSKFILAHNLITLKSVTIFVNFLKSTQIMLTLDLSYNQIEDSCVEDIEKFVIMPHNTPLDEINLSFNKFSKKISWRLFVGNMRYNKYHTYLNFIIYPIPVNPDIFPETAIQYPIASPLINFNIHSALVEEFEQQSFMKHTLNEILPVSSNVIRLIRRLPKGIKLPSTKEEVYKSTQMANRLENFIYAPQFVEGMYDMAEEIMNFQFNIPPVSKGRFIKYLSDKLNEALFIRDHYSVRYILKAFRILGVHFQGYQPRINKLIARNQIVSKKIEQIMNFEVDQMDINRELDEIVREGLRLYLTGNGIDSVYYLKYLRDRWIEKLIQEKYNPEHFIYEKLADKNMNLEDEVTEKQLVIPYEIRVEKSINQNFYLHPWKTNYLLLSQILKVEFDDCLDFLQKSSKKEKFAIYFERIQERIEFMKNQFTLFNYTKFKCSYNDLKINCSRLLSMYRFIVQKNYYLEIPAIARKVQITKEKIITVLNQERFKKDYHVKFYPNINYKAKKANFYNYTNKMTKYGSQMFFQQYLKLKIIMDAMFKMLQKEVMVNSTRIPEEIMPKLVEIIKYIRSAIYPQELKEEFYLRVLSWRSGKFSNNKWLLMYMPFITMYLLPPLAMEKYVIAEILNCDNLNIGELPMNIVSDINKPTQINIQELEKNYVERDWMGSEKMLVSLMRQGGKIKIQVQLLVKRKIEMKIRESSTIGQIVSNLMSQIKDIEDICHFWLYMGEMGDSTNLIVLEQSQHIGEILCEKQEKQKYFLFKRRIFCPEWKYIYKKYSENIVNNLYYDFRYEYLLGQFFINDKEMINLAANMILIDAAQEATNKISFSEAINQKIKNLGHIYKGYMPARALSRYNKNTSELVGTLRDKLNEKLMKKDYLRLLEIKKQMLQQFEDYPEFFCSNYLFLDRNRKLIKLSINWQQIYVNSELEIEVFGLEKIISIIPKAKFLLINYHKHEGVTGKVSLFGDENKILSTALDILTYCVIRIRMLSPALYSAYKYEVLVAKHIKVKVPTKQKQILDTLRRIKKRLQSANPTILDQQLIPYFSQNKYIKVFTTRKLYANASLEKLELIENEEEEAPFDKIKRSKLNDSHDLNGHNVFRTVLPKTKVDEQDDQNIDDFQMSSMGRSFSQPPELSAYNNISTSYKPEPERQPAPNPTPQPRDLDLEPPEMVALKGNPDEEFEPITTAQKTRNRLPPKKNR